MLRNRRKRKNLPTNKHYDKITKRATKVAHHSIISDVSTKIDRQLSSHPGKRLPYGFVSKLVEEMQEHFPWLTRDMVLNNQRKKARSAVGKLIVTEIDEVIRV